MTVPTPADHIRQLVGLMHRVEQTPADHSDIVLTHRRADGSVRRQRFEPRDGGGWTRTEERWSGCRWRIVGSEFVESLDVDVDTSGLDLQ